jgi:hypothetical protein
MHCEEGLSMTKASMTRFVMHCLNNNIEIGQIWPFDYRHKGCQVSVTVRLLPEQFEEFELETKGKLREPPRISLNSSSADRKGLNT